ncbi:MAG: colicin uptake protein TolQ [Bacteroidetes bacterium ADurb.Bin217]|nr:MAG: colicin uptake protein TolQ [Bacteroidetes bacterium ADurb.Bin217]HOS84259.1 MotA/TolQ/ExbB proton channel family protein [Bacteroidales bacterium]
MNLSSLLFGLVQVTVEGTGVNSGAGNVIINATTDDLSFWNMTLKGGWIMIPIFLLSILAVYIMVERYFAIQKAEKEDDNFMKEIKTYIQQGKIEEARIRCKNNTSPVALMIDKGISRIGKPLADVREAIENVGKLEVFKLEKRLPLLATVSGAAPMIGFLGTVLGMIRAFYDMANAGGNFSISMLSNGIYTAMVTTVAGLIVGVVAYLGYNLLVAKVNKVVNKLELRATEFMDLLNEPIE